MPLFNIFSNDLAIDLGTANTLIWMKGKGIVLNEPTVVAVDRTTNQIKAQGKEAQAMIGKTHKDIKIIKPLRDGAIADFEITEGMLRAFIRAVSNSLQPARRIVVCVPSGVTEVGKRAVRDSCEHAGAKEVHLIAEPMASAIGVGMDVSKAVGNMIVDIGGGTTEIAVISLDGIVTSESIQIAGDEMTNAIIDYFKKKHNMLIGELTAERIKCEIGSAIPLEKEMEVQVRGRDIIRGIPKEIVINSIDIREALAPPINIIIQAIKNLLEKTSPDLSADICERGIMLSGGGALLKGIDKRIQQEIGLAIHIADDPLTTVVRGTGKVLENLNQYSKVLMKNSRY